MGQRRQRMPVLPLRDPPAVAHPCGQHCCPWRLCREQRFGDLKMNRAVSSSYTFSPAHCSQNHGRSWCHTHQCWGRQRGPPGLVLLLGTSGWCRGAPGIYWVELAFKGLFQWVSHSREDFTHYWVKTLNEHWWECHSMQMHCWWGQAVFWWIYMRKKTFAGPSKMPEWDPPS